MSDEISAVTFEITRKITYSAEFTIEDLADELDMSTEDAAEAVRDLNNDNYTSGAVKLDEWVVDNCTEWGEDDESLEDLFIDITD